MTIRVTICSPRIPIVDTCKMSAMSFILADKDSFCPDQLVGLVAGWLAGWRWLVAMATKKAAAAMKA